MHELLRRDGVTDLVERAALIAALDLVVAVGDVNLHLAAAMGTPAWGLLPPGSAGPGSSSRTGFCGIRSVRVFRQQDEGDWSEPLSGWRRNFSICSQAPPTKNRSGRNLCLIGSDARHRSRSRWPNSMSSISSTVGTRAALDGLAGRAAVVDQLRHHFVEHGPDLRA